MNDPFRDWANQYDDEFGELPPQHRPAAQRAKLLLSSRRPQQASWFGRGRLLVVSTAIAAGVAGLVVFGPFSPRAPEAARAPVLLDDLPLQIGAPIHATDRVQVLEFPQGSRVSWGEGSKGSLSQASEKAVELKLEEGTLALDVEKKAGRRWLVTAGSFRVYVLGTAFTVSHDPKTESFDVQVTRGKVRVQSPRLEGGERLLRAGEQYHFRPDRAEPPSTKRAPSASLGETHDLSPAPPSDSMPLPSSRPAPAAPKPGESWQNLARAGKYELAIERVNSQGAAGVLSKASAEERVLLGNAARYSGHIDLSRRAYRAARDAAGSSAPLAAYYLAKVALDSNGDQSQAIHWLRTYIREAPTGDLSASARARLISLLSAAGQTNEARKVARDYLKLHPGGPHTKVAQRLLERP